MTAVRAVLVEDTHGHYPGEFPPKGHTPHAAPAEGGKPLSGMKVVFLTGPRATGKTTLTNSLLDHFGATWSKDGTLSLGSHGVGFLGGQRPGAMPGYPGLIAEHGKVGAAQKLLDSLHALKAAGGSVLYGETQSQNVPVKTLRKAQQLGATVHVARVFVNPATQAARLQARVNDLKSGGLKGQGRGNPKADEQIWRHTHAKLRSIGVRARHVDNSQGTTDAFDHLVKTMKTRTSEALRPGPVRATLVEPIPRAFRADLKRKIALRKVMGGKTEAGLSVGRETPGPARDQGPPGAGGDTESGALKDKDTVNYRYGANPEQMCGRCRFFDGASSCARVMGLVREVDTCDLFAPAPPQVRAYFAPWKDSSTVQTTEDTHEHYAGEFASGGSAKKKQPTGSAYGKPRTAADLQRIYGDPQPPGTRWISDVGARQPGKQKKQPTTYATGYGKPRQPMNTRYSRGSDARQAQKDAAARAAGKLTGWGFDRMYPKQYPVKKRTAEATRRHARAYFRHGGRFRTAFIHERDKIGRRP